jgi:hypothetical protein
MQSRELAPTLPEIDAPAERWDEDGSFSAAVVVAGFFGLLTAAMVVLTAIF